jgi:hypothetical protein
MNSKKIVLAALLATVFTPVLAADDLAAGEEAGQQQRQETRIITRDFSELHALDGMRFAGPMMHMHGPAVKDAPYSAEVISERQQNLADGNQIVNKTTSMSYRDRVGRTRQDIMSANGEVRAVTIHDPVAGATYILNPQKKTATKIALLDKEIGKAAAEAARAHIEQLRKEGKLPPPRDGEQRKEMIEKRKEIIIRQFHGGPDGDVKIHVPDGSGMRIEAPSLAMNLNRDGGRELAIGLGPIAGAMGDMKWASKATTKDLGTRDIEGLKAEGKMRSYEIPAGEMGNRNPIVVSDETWNSPDLHVTLLSKHSDPRSGDNVYRLAGVKRDEPAAALFTVPSDYTVKDVTPNINRVIEKKAQ